MNFTPRQSKQRYAELAGIVSACALFLHQGQLWTQSQSTDLGHAFAGQDLFQGSNRGRVKPEKHMGLRTGHLTSISGCLSLSSKKGKLLPEFGAETKRLPYNIDAVRQMPSLIRSWSHPDHD